MPAHGWTFDAKYSELDPGTSEEEGFGYLTNSTYCKPGTEIKTVIITISYNDDKAVKGVGIGITDSTNETSCP